MKVNEIFKSIQGEGRYAGHPVLFIRLSGCTRSCDFCDTQYHMTGKEMTIEKVAKSIINSGLETVVWTGGEPMLQEEEIYKVIEMSSAYEHNLKNYRHCLETNGDILPQAPGYFHYIAFSPKEKRIQDNVLAYCMQLSDQVPSPEWDIKVVTDLKLNKDMISNATILMPLTTYDKDNDKQIQKDVWQHCVDNNIKYAHRIHVEVWGKKKGK